MGAGLWHCFARNGLLKGFKCLLRLAEMLVIYLKFAVPNIIEQARQLIERLLQIGIAEFVPIMAVSFVALPIDMLSVGEYFKGLEVVEPH